MPYRFNTLSISPHDGKIFTALRDLTAQAFSAPVLLAHGQASRVKPSPGDGPVKAAREANLPVEPPHSITQQTKGLLPVASSFLAGCVTPRHLGRGDDQELLSLRQDASAAKHPLLSEALNVKPQAAGSRQVEDKTLGGESHL